VDSVKKYMTDHNWDIVDKLELLGKTRGKSISQMALGWLLSQPEITSPIIGPRTINQLTDNVGSVGLLLSAEEMLALNEVGNQDA
jgi:aryl-alcohol dehydrogenase-like predicted oxidoreductase